MKKTKPIILIIIAFIVALTAVVFAACSNNNEIVEKYVITVLPNYDGGQEFTVEFSANHGGSPMAYISDNFIIDRGTDFHLIGFSANLGEGFGSSTIRTGGSIPTSWFCENRTLTLTAEWFDLRLYNAYHATRARQTYALVRHIGENRDVSLVQELKNGDLVSAYRGGIGGWGSQVSWFIDNVLYETRSVNWYGVVTHNTNYRVPNFNPAQHRGFSFDQLGQAFGLTGVFRIITEAIYDNNASLLMQQRNWYRLFDNYPFATNTRNFTVENGLIVGVEILQGGGASTYTLAFADSDIRELVDNSIPPLDREGISFNNSAVLTFQNTFDSDIQEIRHRGQYDWLHIGLHSVEQLLNRIRIFENDILVTNPTLRLFQDYQATIEITDDFLISEHTILFVRMEN